MPIVIAGYIDIDPDRREEALKGAQPYIEGALSQPGIVYYSWTADLNKPGRVYILEEWDDEASLASHLAGPHYRDMLAHMGQFDMTYAETKKYRVDLIEPVYDETGTPRADFVTAND